MPILKVKGEDSPRTPTLKVKDEPAVEASPHAPAPGGTLATRPPESQTQPVQKARKRGSQHEELEQLPQALEIEKATLSLIFQHPETAFAVFGQNARRGFFTNPVYRELYISGGKFWEANERLDWIGFGQHLRDIGRLDQVGGQGTLMGLFTDMVPLDMLDYYIGILRDTYLRREIQKRSFALAGRAKNEPELEPLLNDMQMMMQDLTAASSPNFCDASNLLNGEMPPLPRVIVHHLLHQGSKMILGGTSKSNKTWALMDLALSVCSGEDWWGFHTNKSKVCYVNLELQEGFFVHRLKSICEHKGVYPEEGQFKILNLRGHAESIEDLRRRFVLFLRAGYFGMVILDPVYKVLGGRDENKAGDIATLLNEIERIAVETGAAIVFAAHYSKGDQWMKDSIDRIGGSGVFARDPDSVLTMTQHESLDCFTVETTLRNLSPISSFVVHWNYPLFMRDEEKNPQLLKGIIGKTKWTEKDVLDEMKIAEGWKARKLQLHLDQERGIAKASFYRIWEKLKTDGKIRVDSDGLWYKVSRDQIHETMRPNDIHETL